MRIKPPPKEELEAVYLDLKSCELVAKRYGCGHGTVYNWLTRYGIPTIPMKGRRLSAEHREKVIKTLQHGAMKGKRHSAETRKLMSESRRGERNSNYNGGITEKVRALRSTKEYAHWKSVVIERAGGICEMCGKELPLEAHHKVSVFRDISKALDPENGMALCWRCHLVADGKEPRNAQK